MHLGVLLHVILRLIKKLKEISKTFFEVILAKKFDKEALKILQIRKKLILIDISKFKLSSDIQVKYLIIIVC